MTTAEIQAAVDALVATIDAGAGDAHEKAVLLLKAKSMLEGAWHVSNQGAAEESAQLVIEKRAVETGVSVVDQKNAAAVLLKKHPNDVTALEVVNLKLIAPDAAVVAQPDGK